MVFLRHQLVINYVLKLSHSYDIVWLEQMCSNRNNRINTLATVSTNALGIGDIRLNNKTQSYYV